MMRSQSKDVRFAIVVLDVIFGFLILQQEEAPDGAGGGKSPIRPLLVNGNGFAHKEASRLEGLLFTPQLVKPIRLHIRAFRGFIELLD
jgi:hypothetical protein